MVSNWDSSVSWLILTSCCASIGTPECARRTGHRTPTVRRPMRSSTLRPGQAAQVFNGGDPYPLSDLELASRLSFFLWSSIPDETLLQEAERGRLSDPEGPGGSRARRMLNSTRARETLVEDFASQWLKTPRAGRPAPAGRHLPGIRPQPSRGHGRGDQALPRPHDPRRQERRGADRRRLHLRQRAPGRALQHSERGRESLPHCRAPRSREAGVVCWATPAS